MSMRSAAVVAGLALGLMSGTAKAAVVSYDYTFIASGFGADAPYQLVSGTFAASFDTSKSGSQTLRSYYINGLPQQYLDYTAEGGVQAKYDAGQSVIYFGNECTGTACSTASGLPTFTLFVPLLSDGIVDSTTSQAFNYGDPSSNKIYTASLVTVTSSVSAVPLPASAPMFGAALLGLAGLGYAANRKKAAAAG